MTTTFKICSALLISLALLTSACTTPAVKVDDSLQANSTPFMVEGKQGWLFNQKLTFGPYQTSKIDRGWTFSYELPFFVSFEGSREKIGFTQLDASGNSAEVNCVGKIRQVTLMKELFGISAEYKNSFAGIIMLNKTPWEFIVYNPEEGTWGNETRGFIRNGSNVIDILPVRELEEGKNLSYQNLGFKFSRNDQVLGQVTVINKGEVRILNTLSDDEKLLLSGLSSALLVRSKLEEQVE